MIYELWDGDDLERWNEIRRIECVNLPHMDKQTKTAIEHLPTPGAILSASCTGELPNNDEIQCELNMLLQL